MATGELVDDIITIVAEKTGTDPISRRPPLAEVIDPDALQRSLERSQNGVSVSFEYQGQRIDVEPGGSLGVRDVAGE